VHDTSMYGAVDGAAVDAPKKRMSLVQRFGKMFEPTVVGLCGGGLRGADAAGDRSGAARRPHDRSDRASARAPCVRTHTVVLAIRSVRLQKSFSETLFNDFQIDASDHGDYGSPIAASSPLEGYVEKRSQQACFCFPSLYLLSQPQ